MVWFSSVWFDCVKFGLVSQFVQVRLGLLEFALFWFCCMVWCGWSGLFRLCYIGAHVEILPGSDLCRYDLQYLY